MKARDRRPEAIKPLSMRARLNLSGVRVGPSDMGRVYMTNDGAETVQRIACDVFTDCVNSGLTFQEALSAVYLTGVENAISAKKDKTT